MKAKRVHRFMCPVSDFDDTLEGCARTWIKVDDAVVGKIERLHSRVPGIHRYASQLNDVQQCREVTTDDPEVRRAALRVNCLGAHDVRRLTRVLLEEGLARDTIGESLEHQWPVGHYRENH